MKMKRERETEMKREREKKQREVNNEECISVTVVIFCGRIVFGINKFRNICSVFFFTKLFLKLICFTSVIIFGGMVCLAANERLIIKELTENPTYLRAG